MKSTTLLLGNLLYSYFHEISSFFHTVLQISDLFLALFSLSNKRCPAGDWQQYQQTSELALHYFAEKVPTYFTSVQRNFRAQMDNFIRQPFQCERPAMYPLCQCCQLFTNSFLHCVEILGFFYHSDFTCNQFWRI